jgi:hypothetical protein
MKLDDVLHIKGRGLVVTLTYDADKLPVSGKDSLRRVSDGRTWLITGVERWAVTRSSWRDCPIGLALKGEGEPSAGDEVEIVKALVNESEGT